MKKLILSLLTLVITSSVFAKKKESFTEDYILEVGSFLHGNNPTNTGEIHLTVLALDPEKDELTVAFEYGYNQRYVEKGENPFILQSPLKIVKLKRNDSYFPAPWRPNEAGYIFRKEVQGREYEVSIAGDFLSSEKSLSAFKPNKVSLGGLGVAFEYLTMRKRISKPAELKALRIAVARSKGAIKCRRTLSQ